MRDRWRVGLLRAGVGIGVLGILLAVPVAWVRFTASAHLRDAANVPDAPVALVLGAGLFDGEPSPFLAGRLDVAADLYARGKVRAVLVSGDNSRTDYDEPSAMRRYLARHGVPERVVVADYAGFDTWDSCVRAKKVFGVDRAIVVTQRFHLPRAVALCRAAGVDTDGVGHDSTGISRVTTAYGEFRELLASSKALWDGLLVRRDPRFLGPRETGVADALGK
ncbi:protein SanA, affects membrane permeability for vancomycin [Streptoalloteichus tenebrarius]|uniref:Protein SanA, affects membrane permeability for vancomycin n=1 Tax=Streptoalloteichus tenebrarius (strain ATCC 17920 / DSM 40477 / JCM 4838 / CBS 697.72 / NBRC 16177 / NCIMB 11028 / NRRL B-12390 / A12253. 1 / ISP 5477) TaxID=1933 RepID=A0ABT1I287_STRSD|nr:ElyC/SanA/YdcF family protein [Streptoalloteichus tenebrarius]MCP2261848.1 protein SanA, affects membrane permeability for vancomycin [Streptoalloteichus tenebrarius]BFE99994.1 ElyC/SanA/YdcF family protein [Streptoalloteichus tenebrarius]